ncbi:methyltransferase [Vibrio sp. SM6]|uniref:tRNA1(Val) (adenine(37)-N6)-methyltransferase n=1 Tax=Vibrio agarilyticus TaxID=2726741 RepID=A0A7X8TPG6_9VIBR|nr:methyltransferase [Vibrio agarilyticus]NLS12257.1 methyltransferase [Vibrio agarilyticus]
MTRKTITKDFKFKQFAIHGGQSGMPVSTDGVLLGAWFQPKHHLRLLDIGCGTGLLSLMAAQRFPNASITAIDIDAHAIAAAQRNFAASPWHQRFSLIHQDFLEYDAATPFDAVICNPPYFNHGEQAQLSQRAIARHTSALKHADLLDRCRSMITSTGCANFILPITEGEAFLRYACESGWYLERRCNVRATKSKPVSRVLLSLTLTECASNTDELIIHRDGQYSQDFINLTADFYLKMTR